MEGLVVNHHGSISQHKAEQMLRDIKTEIQHAHPAETKRLSDLRRVKRELEERIAEATAPQQPEEFVYYVGMPQSMLAHEASCKGQHLIRPRHVYKGNVLPTVCVVERDNKFYPAEAQDAKWLDEVVGATEFNSNYFNAVQAEFIKVGMNIEKAQYKTASSSFWPLGIKVTGNGSCRWVSFPADMKEDVEWFLDCEGACWREA